MKKTFCALMLSMFCPVVFSQENILRNGTFDEGYAKWTGDRKIETMETNKVAVIEAGYIKKKFQQSFSTHGLDAFKISFRYLASSDYKGKGFEVQVFQEKANDGTHWTYKTVQIEKNGVWKEFNWKFDRFDQKGDYYLKIEVSPGKGKLLMTS